MKTKDLTMAAILLALGTVLHYVIPGFVSGIKPDFLLATMFVAIALSNNLKSTVAISLAAGVLAALTTNFPGGQIPSIFDKLASGLSFYLTYNLIRRDNCSVNIFGAGILFFINTMMSGFIFLGSAQIIAGLPAGFFTLVTAIVIPTAIANIFFGTVVYKAFFFGASKAMAN